MVGALEEGGSVPEVPGDHFTVRELAGALNQVLGVCFPDEVWVEGEIASLNRSGRGHVYFQLIEPNDGGPTPASLAIALFSTSRERVNRVLRAAGGSVRMSDGLRIRIKARVDFYEPSGKLQLKMTGIDPSYTLDLMESARDRLLRQLEADGLLRRNAAVPLIDVPIRIGLATSAGSAAEADFLHELASSGHAWHVVRCNTRVQGIGAEHDIAAALSALQRSGVDVIALIRGGGARTDLAVFDSEIVARAIATIGVPVITGIGHEIDTSVADVVAHTAAKTPTACAAVLVARVRIHAEHQEDLWLQIARTARRHLDGRDARLAHTVTQVVTRAPRAARDAERALELAAARISALDPQQALARGWSITRTTDGALVRRSDDIRDGDALVTTLASGQVHSRVMEPDR